MDKNIKECLSMLMASAQMVHKSAIALAAYLEGQADADEYMKRKSQNVQNKSSLSTEQRFFQPTDSIQEIEKMLIELNVPGSVRQRSNGLLEFRSSKFGSVYGRTPEELQEKLKQKIRYEKAHIAKPAKEKIPPIVRILRE